ncbi:hypothetical protein PNOK_0926800 [Pyrrhoderma noxium]|uniref:Uncharacterized protein n=1 Tax=Pyrrhoderma noxium TaxID=2282107 RepID=A0A286U7L1_9AGAM|nr:hypothetical protein PNOK_0926800 [Pyrrhoderma noxium]
MMPRSDIRIMFALKKFSSLALLVLSLSYQVSGHAIVTPALGVTGTPARSDVTKPSTNTPCGKGVNVASAISGSTAVQASGNAFTVSVTNFNGGKDGSTELVKSSIDPSGTGNSFTGGSVTFTTNGDANPSTTGTVQVSGTLPSGTTCTGGNDGASCLVSFTTAGGFGNCVLVSQGTGAGTAAAATNGTTTTTGTGTGNTTTTTTTTGKGHRKNKAKQNAAAAGTRLARSLKMRKELGEQLLKKRSWVWAE